MSHRFDGTRDSTRLSDIYDGELYRRLLLLADVQNISAILNTDGAEIFKSTKLSIWPILLMINELPFCER